MCSLRVRVTEPAVLTLAAAASASGSSAATRAEAVDALEQLLVSDPSLVDVRDGTERTALMWTAERGHAAVVALLLRHGSDINAVDDEGWTALHFAAQAGHVEVVQCLLAGGAQMGLHSIGSGWTPLMMAAQFGHRSCLDKLLEFTSVAQPLSPQQQQSAEAISSDPAQSAVPAHVDDADAEGRTALMLAARNGHLQAVQSLMVHGADDRIADHYHQDAVMHARVNGHDMILRYLNAFHTKMTFLCCCERLKRRAGFVDPGVLAPDLLEHKASAPRDPGRLASNAVSAESSGSFNSLSAAAFWRSFICSDMLEPHCMFLIAKALTYNRAPPQH